MRYLLSSALDNFNYRIFSVNILWLIYNLTYPQKPPKQIHKKKEYLQKYGKHIEKKIFNKIIFVCKIYIKKQFTTYLFLNV